VEEAITALQSAAAQRPGEFRPNYYLAEALLQIEKPATAQPFYEAALKSNPQSSAAELGLARALARQNRLATAEPHFRAAAAQDREYRDALLELAGALEKAGRAEDASAIYQQFPSDPGAQERLGELLIESKHFDRAIPRLEQAIAQSPTVANRLALATAYRMTGASDKQNEQLSKAVAAEPDNYDLRMIYGRALRDERQLAPAADQFTAATGLKPDSNEAWNELASALIGHQDYAQGLAALDKVRALGGETPGGVYFRANTLDKLHHRPQAIESYKLFLQMSQGKSPDQELAARERIRIIETELQRR
jgi:tetratricopeptide (TPR) repeat protein